MRISKRVGNTEELLGYHSACEFSGEISVLTDGPAVVTAQACGASTVLKLNRAALRRLLAENSPLSGLFLETMAFRARQLDSHMMQEEKLAALGKMAAGLAHELNNPATAARRTAKLMLEEVLGTPLRMLSIEVRFTEDQKRELRQFVTSMQNRQVKPPTNALELSDREQELTDWLETRSFPRADEMAPVFAETGVTVDELAGWQKTLDTRFINGLFWIETVLRLSVLARDIETSTDRIAELVAALKEYSYMDQAKFQEIDIHKGLENTIKIMHHKLKKGVQVQRDYGADLPKLCAYAGELNQVWTNLIDNAIDAMDGKGTLTIRTRSIEKGVLVEISDSGKGISPKIKNRIFEPFFTTKSQGQGRGLGLDISYRIIVYRHGGSINVRSKPGETVFSVQLPIQPPREEEILDSVRAAGKGERS